MRFFGAHLLVLFYAVKSAVLADELSPALKAEVKAEAGAVVEL